MIGEVCKNCECYITPPNPWPHDTEPKMCECTNRKEILLEEILRRVKEIESRLKK